MARAKTTADPAEMERLEWPYDWPPPWRNDRLAGHEPAERAMLAAQQSGKLHHAWLLTGPRGIGKATLAWRFARFMLTSEEGGLFGAAPESLDVARAAPGRNRVDARTHSGLFHLRRSLHPKDNRIRDEIAVEDVRDLNAFMRKTEDGRRIAIVDAADEMNRNSANAILKILEEPRPNSVLLIVVHSPGRLLPTIRSRCRRLALQPLSDETVIGLLGDYAPNTEPEERKALARLSEGSIGRALELASAGSLGLYREMVDVLATLPRLDMARLHSFAERFAKRGEEANADWRTFNYLVDGWFKGLARRAAMGEGTIPVVPAENGLHEKLLAVASLDRWIEAWENVARLLSRSDAVSLDRKQTVLGSFLIFQSVMR